MNQQQGPVSCLPVTSKMSKTKKILDEAREQQIKELDLVDKNVVSIDELSGLHFEENLPIHEEFSVHEDLSVNSLIQDKDLPKFGERLQNITVPVGRDAVLICVVDNLQTYKIAWLRVDTQTILTIQTHVITKNHRMTITYSEKRAWILRIKEVKVSDKGWYMCQINTDPMKSQVGYLDVVVPPNILDYLTSTDMVVPEGSSVTLKCAASGSPEPIIIWRREGGDLITLNSTTEVSIYNGSNLMLARVDRLNMGPYLCIASNGIPPSVSKRVMLIVHFSPMITVPNQLVGAAIGHTITLECHSEAFPKSINFWTKDQAIMTPNETIIPETFENTYKVVMKLTIISVDVGNYGDYKCVAKNSIGETDGTISLFHIPQSTIMSTVMPTVSLETAILVQKSNSMKEKSPAHKSLNAISVSTSNIALSNMRNGGDSHDRVSDYRTKNDGNIPSTAIVQNDDEDLLTENEISDASTLFNRAIRLHKTTISLIIFIIQIINFSIQ